MTTSYPASKQEFTTIAGTTITGTDGHAARHNTEDDTIEAIQDTVGTTAGTSILKDFTAGEFAAKTTDTPVKATGAEINTGTNDAKFATPKAIVDAKILTQAWTAWTPDWTNVTIGNATVDCKYTRVGKTVIARGTMILGSGTSISGDIVFSLPIQQAAYSGGDLRRPIGNAILTDAGTAIYTGLVHNGSVLTGTIRGWNAAGTYVAQAVLSATIPFTWTTGDEIGFTIIYEGI